MWQAAVESPYELDFKVKGDEIQKLSVIETLPQLLAEDAHSCITRILPKIQQSLPTASTEFHMAASVIFKQVLEQRLVSPTTFTEVFLQSILSSLESREPVVSHAWLETILDVIELLPVDIIKREILPIAINEGRLSQTVNSRVMCCRLMGKIATRLDPASVKKDILPTVQSLCEDVNSDVRACICLQLHLIAEHIGDNISKLLPLFVQLTSDEESNVRQAAVQTIGLLLPHLQQNTIVDVIVPLIKSICEKAVKAEDHVICVVAQEFGKLAQNTEACLTPTDKTWFIRYFIQLAQMGTSPVKEEAKQEFSFYTTSTNVQVSDRCVECRRSCAFNMPAMFLFAASTTEGVNTLIPTFRNLANDSYYLVRRTIACSLHEVTKVMGSKSSMIKSEFIRLLKDDNEEVLQGLIPHVSGILENLLQNQLLGTDQMESSIIDLGRALIKCEAEISLTNNWRLSALMLNQFEILPKCFSSDFIYTYLVPVVTNRVLYSRPLPVRLAAGRTLLIFLRYNSKTQQKIEIRNRICNEIARGTNCYLRMIFIRMMMEAMSIFSSMYFKEHFFSTLLNMVEDPVANIRLKVITLTPTIKSCLRLPADKKLLSILEIHVCNLKSSEKDRDVIAALNAATSQMDSIEIKVDSQPSPTKLSKYDAEDMRKYEEEKKLEAASTGGGVGSKVGANITNYLKKPNILKIPPSNNSNRPSSAGVDSPVKTNSKGKSQGSTESPKSSVPPKPPLIRQSSLSTPHVADFSKASSMPEIPVTLVDDEFMVDAGIRIPSQLASSQSTSKIPNLQDIIYRKKKMSLHDRERRYTTSFDRSKFYAFNVPKKYSLDYEDLPSKMPPASSSNFSQNSRESQYNPQSGDDRSKSSSSTSPQNRTRFGFEIVGQQRKPLDDKAKRNPMLLDRDRVKPLQPRNAIDRNKRHSSSYGIKLPESGKESKYKFKRHSVEVPDYNPAERSVAGRALRRFSTLDVNHNQGLSKIPVRSVHVSGSRTAPVTRTSSPIRVDSELFDKVAGYKTVEIFSHERRLRRFRSSDEEVDKLCQKF